MLRFAAALRLSALGGVVGGGLMFLSTVVLGRWLGPAEFGRLAVLQSALQVILVFAVAGLDVAAPRSLARSTGHRVPHVAGTALILICASLLIWASVAAILAATDLLGGWINPGLLVGGSIYALALGIRNVVDRMLPAIGLVARQARLRVLEGSLALVLATVGFVGGAAPGTIYVAVAILTTASVSLIVGGLSGILRRLGAISINRADAIELWHYGRLTMLAAIASAGYLYGDRILASVFLTDRQVGILAAYSGVTMLVAGQLIAVVTNVLLPEAARAADRREIVNKLSRLQLVLTIPTTAALMGGLWVSLHLYGPRYPLSPDLLLLTGTWGSLLIYNGLLYVVIVVDSRRAFRWSIATQVMRSALFIGAVIVTGAAGRLNVATLIGFLVAIEVVEAANLRFLARTRLRSVS